MFFHLNFRCQKFDEAFQALVEKLEKNTGAVTIWYIIHIVYGIL